jgi:hypothetical protein
MKIRIEDNSVRLRLRRSEVDTLAETGELWASTDFPEGTFSYGLKAQAGLKDLRAALQDRALVVYIPEKWSATWLASPRVGFDTKMELNNNTLHLLVEKDFVCLDRDMAAQGDQYPNPKGK